MFTMLTVAVYLFILVFVTILFSFMFVSLINMFFFRISFFPFLPVLLGIFRINAAAVVAATITITIATTATGITTGIARLSALLLFQFPFFFLTIFPL